jgi:uncharacterized protein (TIGR00266 family)
MQYQIVFQPSYAILIVSLGAGERVRAEPGALVSMAAGVQIEDGTAGNGIAVCDLVAAEAGDEVSLAPALPGDIAAIDLAEGQVLLVPATTYLASADGVAIEPAPAGATLFPGEQHGLLRLTGPGTVFVGSFGALRAVDLEAGHSYVVDGGHLVAFDGQMGEQAARDGKWKTTSDGGAGRAVSLNGPGRLWLQSRSLAALAERLAAPRGHGHSG